MPRDITLVLSPSEAAYLRQLLGLMRGEGLAGSVLEKLEKQLNVRYRTVELLECIPNSKE